MNDKCAFSKLGRALPTKIDKMIWPREFRAFEYIMRSKKKKMKYLWRKYQTEWTERNGTNGVVKWISRQQLERLFSCQQCERFMFKIKFVDSHPFGVLNFWHHAKRKYNCFKRIANIVFCLLYNKYRTHNRIKWCTKRVKPYTLTIRNL